MREFLQPGQEDLVLDRAVLEVACARRGQKRHPFRNGQRNRFLAINMFAGSDRFRQRRYPPHRRRGVEEYGISGIRQGRIEIGRPAINSVAARE